MKCSVAAICAAVVPAAPPYVMASAMERLSGANTRLPGLARSVWYRSMAKAALPADRAPMSSPGTWGAVRRVAADCAT